MNHHIQIMTTLAERGGISLVPMLFSKSAYSKSSLREIPQQVSNKPWVSSHPNSNPRFCLSDNHPKLKLIFTTPSPVTPGGPSRNFFSLFCFSFFILGSSQKSKHIKHTIWNTIVMLSILDGCPSPNCHCLNQGLSWLSQIIRAPCWWKPFNHFFFLGPQTIYSQDSQCRFKDLDSAHKFGCWMELDPKSMCLPCPGSANEARRAKRNPAAPNFQGDISVCRRGRDLWWKPTMTGMQLLCFQLKWNTLKTV